MAVFMISFDGDARQDNQNLSNINPKNSRLLEVVSPFHDL